MLLDDKLLGTDSDYRGAELKLSHELHEEFDALCLRSNFVGLYQLNPLIRKEP